jgi:recombinational DNA repair protein RecT
LALVLRKFKEGENFMAQDLKKVKNIMSDVEDVKADDPDMIEKLNEIARRVAEAQGKVLSSVKPRSNNLDNVDPMDELGCEGCQ